MSKMVFFSVVSQPHNFLVDKRKKIYLLSNVIASVAVRFAFRLFLIVRNIYANVSDASKSIQ